MREAVNIDRSSKYVHSDKINNRRRSLFPSERVDKYFNNSELDEINLLSTSDLECEYQYGGESHINLIASTNLVSDILCTPKSKNYPPSEQSMSPLYLSPYRNIQVQKSILCAVSPSKHLKTPNDSNIHCGILPKLSRKCSQEHVTHKLNSQQTPLLTNLPKCSKVRTTLFPELDTISFTPKQFYPKIDFHKPFSDKKILFKSTDTKMVPKAEKRSEIKNTKKRLLGRINSGVRHNIKKPKKQKVLDLKISKTYLAKIKTFKKDEVVTSELKGFLKDLEELKESRKIQLIQHSSIENTSTFLGDNTSSIMKRSHDSTEDVVLKKQKLNSNEALGTEFSDYFDPKLTALANDDLELGCSHNINKILYSLNDSIDQDKQNESKDNSNSNIERSFNETLLSPTSEMCNMASVMKIESPKKVTNLNLLFQNMNDNSLSNLDAENSRQYEEKPNHIQYFSIFYPNSKLTNKSEDVPKTEFSGKRKKTRISSNQMLLDAGQKRFGLVECSQCNYVYHAGDPNDETMHENHHNATHILQFSGWRNERVVDTLPNCSRIIQVLPTDSKVWTEKVKRVIEVINRDMGYYDMTLDINTSKVFLFIANRTIVGCLVAESKTRGFKIVSSDIEIDLCSTEEYPIQCGVSRIWVAPRCRRKGIASKLMDILKSHFIPGRLLSNCDIAFSSPSTDGKLFATKYFQTKNFFTYFD